MQVCYLLLSSLLFLNDSSPTEIYTLSLHDALPIWLWQAHAARRIPHHLARGQGRHQSENHRTKRLRGFQIDDALDRKSTRLNSSHANISYAVFCLKKKNSRTSSSHLLLVCEHRTNS